jgi:hypothetical protein
VSRTPGSVDQDLKWYVATAIFEAIKDNPHFQAIEDLHSIECQRVDNLNLRVRVRANHGGARGQKYHYYNVRVSESRG